MTWVDPLSHGPSMLPNATPTWDPYFASAPIRCRFCRRTEPGPPVLLGRPDEGYWPECCGWPMLPVLGLQADAGGPNESTPPDVNPEAFAPWAERRLDDRRPVRRGALGEVRRGWLGSGPNLAAGLVDVSTGGVQVWVSAPVRPGDRVLVGLTPPGVGWATVREPAEVRWCVSGPGGPCRAGVQLLRPIAIDDLRKLAEPA